MLCGRVGVLDYTHFASHVLVHISIHNLIHIAIYLRFAK